MNKEELLSAMQAIVDVADKETRSLTEDEISSYEAYETQLEAAKKTKKIQKRQAEFTKIPKPISTMIGEHKDSDEGEAAFRHYLRTGKENTDLIPGNGDTEYRAQAEVGSQGGFLVPPGFRTEIIERLKLYGGVQREATQFVTSTGQPIQWPTIDDTASLGEITAEGGSTTAGVDLVFGQGTLTAYKYQAGGAGSAPITVSVELLQDSAFDVNSFVGKALGIRIGRKIASHLVKGTRSGQPQGLAVGTALAYTGMGTGGLAYSDLVQTIHTVDPLYRPNAKWIFNDNALSQIRQLVDKNNRPLWLPQQESGMGNMPGGSLLGYPVVIDQAFDNLASGTATNSVVWGAFGDIEAAYVYRSVLDIEVLVDPYTRMQYGQVQYVAWMRADGMVQNKYAFTAITGN